MVYVGYYAKITDMFHVSVRGFALFQAFRHAAATPCALSEDGTCNRKFELVAKLIKLWLFIVHTRNLYALCCFGGYEQTNF